MADSWAVPIIMHNSSSGGGITSSKTEAAITKGVAIDCKAIYIGTGGTLVIARSGVAGPSFINVPNGAIIPIVLSKDRNDSVDATSTTSDMVALNF